MKIPKTIKILGHKITVYWSNGALELDDDTGCRGLAHLLTNKIGLSRQIEGDELTESVIAESFLHEITHHIADKLGLELEEYQVAGIACGLLQVIRDNKLDFRG